LVTFPERKKPQRNCATREIKQKEDNVTFWVARVGCSSLAS